MKKVPRRFLGPEDVAIRSTKEKEKGLGLFALHDLPINCRIVYQGVRHSFSSPENKKALDELTRESRYVMEIKKGVYLDGNPVHGHWPSSFLNEPSPGETANMVFAHQGRGPDRVPVAVTVRPIKAGEELCVHYGSSYIRNYKVGKQARRPPWWSKS